MQETYSLWCTTPALEQRCLPNAVESSESCQRGSEAEGSQCECSCLSAVGRVIVPWRHHSAKPAAAALKHVFVIQLSILSETGESQNTEKVFPHWYNDSTKVKE